MESRVSVDIAATPEEVWQVITDIENSKNVVSGIMDIEILEPATGPSIKGMKWRETRMMFGKEATEVMWITHADAPDFYDTRAESHGAVYTTRVAVEATADGSRLTMTFEGQPVKFGAKVMWALTGWMMKGPMKKAITQDLADIKAAVES